MSDDLSRYITPQYIKILLNCKPGTKVLSLIDSEEFNINKIYIIGGKYHGTVSTYHDQGKWLGLVNCEYSNDNQGVIIGDHYAFKILDDNYISNSPKNKPKGYS